MLKTLGSMLSTANRQGVDQEIRHMSRVAQCTQRFTTTSTCKEELRYFLELKIAN